MPKLNKSQANRATKLHQRSLAQAKKAAIAVGWQPKFVNQVANLEWSLYDLQRMKQRGEATTKQTNAILAVRDAAKFEMLGLFAQSQA